MTFVFLFLAYFILIENNLLWKIFTPVWLTCRESLFCFQIKDWTIYKVALWKLAVIWHNIFYLCAQTQGKSQLTIQASLI